jgi:hypothetical protein
MSRSIDNRVQRLEGNPSGFVVSVLYRDEEEAPTVPPDSYHLIIDLRPKSRTWGMGTTQPTRPELETLPSSLGDGT